MACNLNEIKGDSLDKIRIIIQGKAKSIDVKDDHAVFDYGEQYKIKRLDQATKAAEKKQIKIEQWAEKKFGKAFSKGWSSLKTTPSSVILEYGFPQNLSKSYERKIARDNRNPITDLENNSANEYFYAGEIYNTLEDMQLAMEQDIDYLPMADDFSNVNFENYIISKNMLANKMEKRLADLKSNRRFKKTAELSEEIREVKEILDDVNAEIGELESTENIFDKVKESFDNDFNMIEDLISDDKPSIANMHEAEHMLSYLIHISDYSSNNVDNDFIIDKSNTDNLNPKVKQLLDDVAAKTKTLSTKVHNVKKGYLLDIIDSSPKIKKMFPEQEIEEMKKQMLDDVPDIDIISQMFLSVDKQYFNKDSMLAQVIRQELESSRSFNKSFAAGFIQRLNDVAPAAKKKLKEKGYTVSFKPIGFSIFGDANYDLFYQKKDNGSKSGRMVDKFSNKWFDKHFSFFSSNNADYWEAKKTKNWEELNEVLADKFKWLDNNVDFIDIGKIPEIIEDPLFKNWQAQFDTDNSQAYKDELISKIGQHHYDKIVQEQKENLEDYKTSMKHDIRAALTAEGVSTFAELSSKSQHGLNIKIVRNNPFAVIESQKKNQGGRVDYDTGNSSNQYQSHIVYNSYIPKENIKKRNINTGEVTQSDTGFYDDNFKEIESDKDLLAFWEIMNESVSYINMTMNDGSNILMHGALPQQKQNITDILLNKDIGFKGKFMFLLNETKQTIKDTLSINEDYAPRNSDTINKGGIRSVQQDVNIRMRTQQMKLENLLNEKIDNSTEINLKTESREVVDYFMDLAGLEDHQQLYAKVGDKVNAKRSIRELLTNNVMQEQSYNLPVMLRMYLDMVSEYKSQKDSQPKISILKDLYENINDAKSNDNNDGVRKQITNIINSNAKRYQKKRFKSIKTMDIWYDKNLLNRSDSETWLNVSKALGKKNYSEEEKEFKEEAEKLLESLDSTIEELEETNPEDSKLDELKNEKAEIKKILENIGKEYTVASAYNAVVNKFSVYLGLAWNVGAAIINRFQGWYVGTINDTGAYWTAGNFVVANNFIMKKVLRQLPGNDKYKNEIKKTRLLIKKLDILQDETNQLDRAKTDSGVVGIKRKINPFYLTEYIEWHNQTPQILSMLMDEKITDKDGNTVQIFNGKGFPAHKIENGELVLKDNFKVGENVNNWQDFSSSKFAELKGKMSDTIAILNGDYSKTGGIVAKANVVGKTFMTFLTWLPNQLWMRFANNQTNLALGKKNFDGFYTGSFKTAKTGAASAALISTAAFLAAGPAGALIAAPVLLGQAYKLYKSKTSLSELKIASQLAKAGKGIVQNMVGIPINTLIGKNVVGKEKFENLDIADAQRHNLMTLVNEISMLLLMTIAKATIKAMYGNNDDEEPVYLDKARKAKNPNYGKNIRSDEEKSFYNFMENQVTKVIDDVGLYTNPQTLYETILQRNSITSWFNKITAIEAAYTKWTQGLDTISSGPNKGESRMVNELQKAFLPGIMQGTDSFTTLGLGKYMNQEFVTNEDMDSWFYTDYKNDRKIIRSERASLSQEITEYWQDELDYDNLDAETQFRLDKKIKKMVRKEIGIKVPYPEKYKYDDDQKRID